MSAGKHQAARRLTCEIASSMTAATELRPVTLEPAPLPTPPSPKDAVMTRVKIFDFWFHTTGFVHVGQTDASAA
jgi:hypothetical protein